MHDVQKVEDNHGQVAKDVLGNQIYIENVTIENQATSKTNPVVEIFNDFYDLRKKLVQPSSFLLAGFYFLGLCISVYMMKIDHNFDSAFDMSKSFILALLLLSSLTWFNRRFYADSKTKDWEDHHKFTLFIILLTIDIIVFSLLAYLMV